MKLVPLSAILIKNRQRKIVSPQKVNEYKTSIAERGLLHAPITITEVHDGVEVERLIAGEHRFKAIELLAKEGLLYFYDGMPVQPGFIPTVTLADFLTEADLKEAELDENVRRADLTWQERAEALADLHNLRQQDNPKQTLAATAKELSEKGATQVPRRIEQQVRESVAVAKHLGNAKIANARNATEAYALVMKLEEESINAALAKKQIAGMVGRPDVEVRNGDCLVALPAMDSGIADLFLSDPPYGISASGGGFSSRTVHHHNYNDTAANAKAIALAILTEGFRICKPRANLFMFCDIDLFPWLKETAANMGWTPFRRPMIWQKSESEGMAPWGGQGPRITTEFIFYATKGQKGMISSPVDLLNVKRVSRSARIHAAEKPIELLRKLIECTTLPGDLVIDPCCGSGSTMVACKELRRRGIGIEKDADYYNTAMANVYGEKRSDADNTLATI